MNFVRPRYQSVILCFLIMFFLCGCFQKVLKESGIDEMKDKTVYNRVPFRTYQADNLVYYTNRFHGGIYIPAGSACFIKNISDESIWFVVDDKDYFLVYWLGQTTAENISESFEKFFVEDKSEVGLGEINPKFRPNVSVGIAEIGMTKEEVLLAIGYPAFLGVKDRTFDDTRENILLRNDWYYYSKTRSKADKLLRFKGERLYQIEK